MGRRRAAESVPAVEKGIEEVIITHRKTRRGVRTTEKTVPVLVPSKEKSEQPSSSKKGKRRQLHPAEVEASKGQPSTMNAAMEHEFTDEQVDHLPHPEMEQGL